MDGVNGCIADDPLFLDAAAGDYRLRTEYGRLIGPDTWVHDAQTSPAIDAGLNHHWHAGSTDLEGNPRLKRGRFDSAAIRVDMGAYERTARPRGSLMLVR